ncbi:MAG: hypothetical protein SPI35_01020 [Porphyromonas sp.]|nr:hypothetical protein [Porphyromonas sp.]
MGTILNRTLTAIAAILLALPASWAQNDSEWDDVYVTRKQSRKERQERKNRDRHAYEDAGEVYYYEDYDDDYDYDIDRYNGRYQNQDEEETYNSKLRYNKKKKRLGRYSSRLSRFHSNSAVVVVDGAYGVDVYYNDGHYELYSELDPYDYYYDRCNIVSIGINWGRPGWYSSWDYYYDRWFFGSFYPWYHTYPPFHWGNHRFWGYRPHFRWGWGNYGYGYNHGYHDGFLDGYYSGYYGIGGYAGYYDPYEGIHISRKDLYPNGRSGGLRGQTSVLPANAPTRNSGNQTIASRNSGLSASSAQGTLNRNYNRGAFWNGNVYRQQDQSKLSAQPERNYNRRDLNINRSDRPIQRFDEPIRNNQSNVVTRPERNYNRRDLNINRSDRPIQRFDEPIRNNQSNVVTRPERNYNRRDLNINRNDRPIQRFNEPIRSNQGSVITRPERSINRQDLNINRNDSPIRRYEEPSRNISRPERNSSSFDRPVQRYEAPVRSNSSSSFDRPERNNSQTNSSSFNRNGGGNASSLGRR